MPKISLHIKLKKFADKEDIVRYFSDCAKRFNLEGWQIELESDTTVVGLCDYNKKTIILSNKYCYRLPAREVQDTILHEIAHALTPGHGHNRVWKRKALEIGCSGKVDCDVQDYDRYVFSCSGSCEWSVTRAVYDKLYWDSVMCQYCLSKICVVDREKI